MPVDTRIEDLANDLNDIKGRLSVVEIEMNFSKRELQDVRDLYKHLETLLRDSDQMVSRMNTLISVQEEVIQQLKDSTKSKEEKDNKEVDYLRDRIEDLNRFRYKSIGITVSTVFILNMILLFFLRLI